VTMGRTTGRRLRAMAFAAILLTSACAGGGGSTGTGISGLTVAQGNVASTQTSAKRATRVWLARWLDAFAPVRAADAVSGVPNVVVRIEGTTLATTTDANGSFTLEGSFGGPTTMSFESAGGPPTRLTVNIPTGGTLTLIDVRLDENRGEARADSRNLDFDGVVTGSNCTAGTLEMVSQATPSDGNRYPVNVQSATLHDTTGAPIVCNDISSGDVLSVQGLLRDDGGVDCDRADRRERRGPG